MVAFAILILFQFTVVLVLNWNKIKMAVDPVENHARIPKIMSGVVFMPINTQKKTKKNLAFLAILERFYVFAISAQ